MGKNIDLKYINTENEMKKLWSLHKEYMERDIFKNDELGVELTEDDRKYFLSKEYRDEINKILERDINKGYGIFFISENNIIGFSTFCRYDSEDGKVFILDFCILPEFRDKNFGTKCFSLLKDIEISKGGSYFELNISNRRNMNFWQKQGFKFVGIDEYGVVKLSTNENEVFLTEIYDNNLKEIALLKIYNEQKKFVADPMTILAKAYLYRNNNSKVYGIKFDKKIIGMIMVREIYEKPVCYELQQFFIDMNYQSKGLGTKALNLIIDYLYIERKFENIELAVQKDNIDGIKFYKKNGFNDVNILDEKLKVLSYNFKNKDNIYK